MSLENGNLFNISKKPKVAIVGFGVVGHAYHKLFPDAIVYDPPRGIFGCKVNDAGEPLEGEVNASEEHGKLSVNDCDIALVAVFTPLVEGKLDITIVEDVVNWLETPLILIKSALHPGTTDRLTRSTGKNIAVSVEFIGEGNYPIHFWKYPHQNDPRLHQMLIVGSTNLKVAEACAQVLWSRMSPDVKIHIVTALEAEITKLVENSYGALKVTFINSLLSLALKSNTSFLRMHQAWQSDPRTDSMHLRAVEHDRGWVSKCWDKDVPALVDYSREVGADDMADLFQSILDINVKHLELNGEKVDAEK